MKFKKLIALAVFSIFLFGCVTMPTFSALPKGFTTKNVMTIETGMPSTKILELFGNPKNVEVTGCGKQPNIWSCTIWKYGDPPYDNAIFYFQRKHDSLILNHFSVDRD
jgi:hypothetical protein